MLRTGFLKKSACQIWCKSYLGWNQPLMKFLEAANNFPKLLEVGKHFPKFIKFVKNFMKFVEFASNLTKFVKFVNNFTKFPGLANNFYEICRSCEQKWEKTLQHLWNLPITLLMFVGLSNRFWKVWSSDFWDPQKHYEICRLEGWI